MTQLRNLGQPFGGQGGIINIPAPAGSALAGQIQMQSMQGLGQALGQYLGQRKQQQLGQLDLQDLQNYLQEIDLAKQLPMGTGPEPVFPQMRSRKFQNLQAQALAGRILAPPVEPFTLTPGAERRAGTGQLIAKAEAAPMLPTQKAAQAKLDAYNKAKAVPIPERTKHQQAVVEKYEMGQALVQINLGKASPTERTSIAETRASVDALNNIKELYDSAKTRTGPIVGRLDPILGLFGLTKQEQEDFMAATSTFRNRIIKEITGAQMSEVEAKRILKQVPQETDPPARWEAKWRQSKKNLEMLQKRRLEILQQSGLQVPGGQMIDIKNMTDEELRKLAGIE